MRIHSSVIHLINDQHFCNLRKMCNYVKNLKTIRLINAETNYILYGKVDFYAPLPTKLSTLLQHSDQKSPNQRKFVTQNTHIYHLEKNRSDLLLNG
jgi:hypothetical protein